MSEEEAKMKKKDREAYRATLPYDCISKRIAAQLSEMVGVEGAACGARPHPAWRQSQRL